MKSTVAYVLLIVNLSAFACDNCNVYVGINPNDFYHNIGIRLRTRYHQGTFDNAGSLMLKHGGESSILTNSTLKETYQRIELTGRYFWRPKWNTQIIAPYVMNAQEVNESLEYFVQGIGDLIILQNYMVFNTKELSDSISFKHRLMMGVGLKLPTGRINIERPKGIPDIDLQPGTGSWDALMSITYSAMFRKLGTMVNGNYKLNSYNKEDFRYGNTINLTANIFYLLNVNDNFQLMPSIGVYSEHFSHDFISRELVEESGGNTWMANGGLSGYVKKIKIQFNYQYAFNNKLNDKQLIPTRWRYNLGVYYNF